MNPSWAPAVSRANWKSGKANFSNPLFACIFPEFCLSKWYEHKNTPVTAASFEKIFAAIAAKGTIRRRSRAGKIAKDLAGWREIAWEALERKNLGDMLRRAIEALSAKYREVLFLQDVKNLNTAETAWVLDIPVGAVRSRLQRARMQVRGALASSLLPNPGEKNSGLGNSYAEGIPANRKAQDRSRIGTVKLAPLQGCFGA